MTNSTGDPLLCNAALTCVNSGAAVGCCPNTLPGCTAIYTTCYNYGDICDESCELDDNIRKCDAVYPYCGTYAFYGGTHLYNCQATSDFSAETVEFLADFYLTAIGSTLAPSSEPFGFDRASATRYITLSSSPSSVPSSTSSSSVSHHLTQDVVRGIAIGVSVGVCAIFILVAWLIVRKRRQNRMKRASRPNLPPAYTPAAGAPPPSMQQQGIYQSVPQQDQLYPPTQAGYYTTGKDDVNTSTAALSPGSPPQAQGQQRHSIPNTALLSPSSTQGHLPGSDYYKGAGPVSPTITEVDGADRPLPEADGVQRPLSSMSPMQTGGISPISTDGGHGAAIQQGHFMQQYGNPAQASPVQVGQFGMNAQSQGQGRPVNSGYVRPHPRTYEMEPTQPYLGPHEMPGGRQ